MENIIIVILVLAALFAAAYYLYRAKKRGETCIGCPYAKQCANRQHGCAAQSNGQAPKNAGKQT